MVEKQFYQKNHFGVFRELSEYIIKWTKETNGNVVLIGDYNNPWYINRYLGDLKPRFLDLYRTTDDTGLATLKSIVDTSEKKWLVYSWSTINQVPEVEEIIRYRYPHVVSRKTYFNSEVVLFSKGELPKPDIKFQFLKSDNWSYNPDKVVEDSSGTTKILLDAESPFGPTFSINIDSIRGLGISAITILIEAVTQPNSSDIQMVYDQANQAGGYSWQSDAFSRQFNAKSPNWGVFHYQLNLNSDTLGTLKVYPWSPHGTECELSKMEIRLIKAEIQ